MMSSRGSKAAARAIRIDCKLNFNTTRSLSEPVVAPFFLGIDRFLMFAAL
jgi:hypothetical protein